MTPTRILFPLLVLAAASPALAQGVRPPPPQPILVCQMQPRGVGSGQVTVTNVGQAPVEAGRQIIVTYNQAGAGAQAYALRSPLPPGGSQTLPLMGASMLARGCSATPG